MGNTYQEPTPHRIWQVLQEVQSLHHDTREYVDFSVEDKRLAVFLIQGGAISSASSAFQLNEMGYGVPVAQQWRFIREANDLIEYIDELPEGDRHIKGWFKKEVVERPKSWHKKADISQREEKYGQTPQQIKHLDELIEKLGSETSKYMHPTLVASRANAYGHDYVFDYNHRSTQGIFGPKLMSEAFIVPAIHCLTSAPTTFPQQFAEWPKLRKVITELIGR